MTMRSRSEAAVISREPSLPIARTATRPPAHPAVLAREFRADPLQQRGDQRLARARYRRARPCRGRARPTAAGRRSETSPRRRSRGRGRASSSKSRRRRRGTLRPAPPARLRRGFRRSRATRPGSIAASSTCGREAHDLREARRAAEQIAEQFAHRRVRAQDRQQLDRRRHARKRGVERGERRVGIAGAGERLQQRRRQLRQHLARARALDGRAAAEMPAADRLGRLPRDAGSRGGAASSSVSGSSTTPVKTRLPASASSVGASSNRRA